MSEPKLVSPLLDGFIMGEAISGHHGVRCCPAIQENTDERYIVKIISIPASQVQLDALLLTGAYSDQSQALAYFKELADGVVGETNILDRLSRMEGFVPYLGHQIHQMESGVGYDVYLVAPYRRSLEKLMRAEPLTHLGAVNLGLDMCAALATCRRAGYLYADLKPSNIFRSETQGYHIGDLGFISLSSLKYASLPEKYRSSYTAPEITDALSSLNDTLDIYALGLTLYQVYNNGELPFEGTAPAQILPPPMYADYEMAEIILKACAPNPWDRWQDPAQMGQALVNYMQRNSVNDTPIVPPPLVIEDEPEEIEEFLTEEENDAELAELLAMIPDEEPPAQEPDISENNVEDEDPTEAPADEKPSEAPVDTEIAEEPTTLPEAEIGEPADDTDEMIQLSFMDEMETDETLPSEENAAGLTDADVTDEVAQMLAQADDLISHELPEPVVAPDPIDIPIPPPIVLEPQVDEPLAEDAPEEDIPADTSTEEPEQSAFEQEEAEEDLPFGEGKMDDHIHHSHSRHKRRILRRCIAAAVILLLLAAAAVGAKYWYEAFYLQPIHGLEIFGTTTEIQVAIESDVDESQLIVYCTDVYGNARNSTVTNGIAVFTDLTPGTQYRIQVDISGLHKLTGKTAGTYTTTDVTEILNFSANRGPEDGSVVLSFSVDGPDIENWIVEYGSSPDVPPQRIEFTGHAVTITGLTMGREYTFRLLTAEDILLSGTSKLTYTPYEVVCAQDLTVTACGGGSLTVQWALPEEAAVQNWIVRCFNDAGYDQTLTTAQTSLTFTGLDHTTGYTITVTAEGMPKSVSTEVTADPINVTGFRAEVTAPWAMTLSWDFTGTAPANGWVLTYTVDGGEPISVNCSDNSAIIALSPNTTCTFEIAPVDEITFFCVPYTYGPVQTAVFEGYYVTANNMTFTMHLGSKEQNIFAAGEQATLKGAMDCKYNESEDPIVSTFVIRSTDNELISAETYTCSWKKLWKKRACTLDIPQLPTQAGAYMLDLYFNEMFVTTLSFTIT